MIPAFLAAWSMPFCEPFESQRPNHTVLLTSPHFVPKGLEVAAMGLEIVTQLLMNAQQAKNANDLKIFFIIDDFFCNYNNRGQFLVTKIIVFVKKNTFMRFFMRIRIVFLLMADYRMVICFLFRLIIVSTFRS